MFNKTNYYKITVVSFLTVIVIVIFSPLAVSRKDGVVEFINNNFSFITSSKTNNLGNIYEVTVTDKNIVPEKIYIKKNDVLHFVNSTDSRVVFENIDGETNFNLKSKSDFFKKFTDVGNYNTAVKYKNDTFQLEIFVK